MLVSITATAQSDKDFKIYFSPDSDVTYRLFKTQNMHIFIKLNTSDGTMKLVQYSTESIDDMLEVSLSDTKLATGNDVKNGRFYLYPTDNFFTFLLLDQVDGRVWQVQWSTDPKDFGVFRIN
jgi:hypothetical protein